MPDQRTRFARARCSFVVFAVLAFAGPGEANPHALPPSPPPSQTITRITSLRAQGDWTRALALCETALRRHPDDRGLKLQRILILADAGAASRARQLAGQLSPPVSTALRARLDADVAARQVRRARYAPEPRTGNPYAMADQAAAQLAAIARRYRQSEPAVAKRAELDRLIALQAGGRDAAVVAAYDAMSPAQRQALPQYLSGPVADALLRMRRPEEAIALLQRHYKPGAAIPEGTSDPAIVLSYALSESGHYARARKVIDRATAAQPVWKHVSSQKASQPNPNRSEDALNAALLRAYNQLLATSWSRLRRGVDEAPDNASWRRELGNVERYRGWPRLAEQDLLIAQNLDPLDINTRLALIETWRDLGDFDRVEPALRPLEKRYTRSERVQRERLAWDRQRGWQLDAEQGFGRGHSPDFGDRDNNTQVELASPLLARHWRVYGLGRRAGASLPEGHATRSQFGVGLRGQWRGLLAYVQALTPLDRFSGKTAWEAGFDWGLSDHWSWQTDASTSSADAPLRGRYYGITGRSVNSRLQWRASELLRASLHAGVMNLSDGNHRQNYGADVMGRVWTGPRLLIDLGGAADTSRNSLLNQPYYDPARDRSMTLNAHIEQTLIDRYERSWKQTLDMAAGRYSERGYSTGWMADVVYGQRYAPHDGLRFGWQLGWHNQPYDGRRESRVTLALNMHWGE
jgi:biofilm PGA synthesis protein PgaA